MKKVLIALAVIGAIAAIVTIFMRRRSSDELEEWSELAGITEESTAGSEQAA
jgi:hypothetical protein